MPYRLEDDRFERVLRSCDEAVAGKLVLRLEGHRLIVSRPWRRRRLIGGLAAAVLLGAALALAGTIRRVILEDTFASSLEIVVWLTPALSVAVLTMLAARPRVTTVDRARRLATVRGGILRVSHALAGAGRVRLSRDLDEKWVEAIVGFDDGMDVIAVRVTGSASARIKTLALALAGWLGWGLIERTSEEDLERLHDFDASLGLVPAREKSAAPGSRRGPPALETAAEVAIALVRILDAL